jgi:hypothetical protein
MKANNPAGKPSLAPFFGQPQLDREMRSQTGRPAFKEHPTRLHVFYRHIYAKNADNADN